MSNALYQIDITHEAYGGRVPERAWRRLSRHRSLPNLHRAHVRARRSMHPQPNAWTGHVRIVRVRDLMLMEIEPQWDGIDWTPALHELADYADDIASARP